MNLTSEEKYFVWLNSFSFLTPAKIKNFKQELGSYEKVFIEASLKNNYFNNKMESDELNKFYYSATKEFIDCLFKNLQNQKVGILTKNSPEYNKFFNEKIGLSEIDILYYKGDLSLLNSKSIAIVGTRNPDVYGKKVTEMFAMELAENGLTIISGLATGVDSIAHRTCLNAGGKTIAVLGGGFNNIYPSFNLALAEEIGKKGLLLSEYPPQALPTGFHFPIRNRIIAAISDAVLITQAGEKSGSMHTKNYAIDYGKELYVIPADITREASKGTNNVIAGFPYSVVFSPDEILDKLGIKKAEKQVKDLQLSIEERLVLDAIGSEETHFSEILSKTKMDSKTLSSLLTILRVSGIIKQLPGNFYSK